MQSGCDNSSDRADRKVQEQIDQSLAHATPKGELPVVPTALTSAASDRNASPAVRAETNSWLAQAEVRRAAALLDRASREELAARRLISEINRLTARLQSNAAVIAGLQNLQPTQERAALEQHRGEIQGAKDPVWKKHETGALPGLKAVNERLASLQEQIGKLEQQSKDTAGQRGRLLAEAERLERESEGAAGQQSVDLYNRSTEARKKAADMGVQIDAVEAKLLPLRQDLQLAQGEKQQLTKAVEAFESRLQGTEESWKKVQQQIEALNALSKSLVGPNPGEPQTPPANFPAAEQAGASEDSSTPAPATGPASRPAAKSGAPLSPGSLAGKLRWLSHLSKSVEAERTEAEGLLKGTRGNARKARRG